MEVIISRKNFLNAGILAEKITGKNLNLPILNSFLISTQRGKIQITATNLEIGFEITAPAKIIKEGKIIVSAKIINNIINNLTDEIVTLKQENNNLKIITNNSLAVLNTSSLEDFPVLPKFHKENYFEITILDFFNGLKSSYFAASISSLKPEIASIYFYNTENQFIFAATDSFRLAEKNILHNLKNNPFSLLLPAKSVKELIYILNEIKDKEKKIEIGFSKNEFLISSDVFNFFSRLTEGSFVDYKQIIPKKSLGEIIINSDEFVNALKTANIFLGRLNDIILEIIPEEQILEFKTSNPELGEYYYKAQILKNGFHNLEKDKIQITFNLKYLLDGIEQISSSRTVLKINEEGKPIIIQGEDDSSFIYLVMPMKI